MTDLLQILRKPPVPRSASAELCEFCSVEIDAAHGHIVDLARRMILCVCRPCYLLFAHDGTGGKRFRSVPDRYAILAGDRGAGDAWEALSIPVGLAFFFTTGATGRTTAFYPSPGGATESELPIDVWDEMVRGIPGLSSLRPDVEALLVRRSGGPSAARTDALIVPIDACYELVGRIRRAWRGLQGGDEMQGEVDAFFAHAIARAGGVPREGAQA